MQDYIPRTIDINGVIDPVTVKQFDNNSRFLHVKFKDIDLTDVEDNSFDLADCTAAIYIEPEGNTDPSLVSYVAGEVESAESGIVTFLLPGGVTQNVGRYTCEIWIYGSDETRPIISTRPFTLIVEKSIRNDSAIEASQDFSALDDMLSSAAETLTALHGYEERITDAESDIGDLKAGLVTPEMYGAKGDGAADDTQAIQAAIDGSPGKTVTFRGKYRISAPILTPRQNSDKVALFFRRGASLIADESFTGSYMLLIGEKGETASGYSNSFGDCGVYNAFLDCGGKCGGIKVEHVHLAKIGHVTAVNVKGVGLYIGQSNNVSADAYVNYFESFGVDANDTGNIGLHVDSSDNKIYHVRVSGCNVGVNLTGGGNYLEDVHPLYTNASSHSSYESSVAFNIAANRQILTNCYADSFSKAINVAGDYVWQASHFYAYWYDSFGSCTVINMQSAGQFKGIVNGLTVGFYSNDDGGNFGLKCPDLYQAITAGEFGIRGLEMWADSFDKLKYPNYDLIWRADVTRHPYFGVKKATAATDGYFFAGALRKSGYKISGRLKTYSQGDCAELLIAMSSSGAPSITATALNGFSGTVEFAIAKSVTVDGVTYYGLYVKQTVSGSFAVTLDNIAAPPVLPMTFNRNSAAVTLASADIAASFTLNPQS